MVVLLGKEACLGINAWTTGIYTMYMYMYIAHDMYSHTYIQVHVLQECLMLAVEWYR